MPKFSRNLPVTPKSVTDSLNAAQPNDNYAVIDSEHANDSEAATVDDENEYNADFDDSASDDQQKFVLAPTPAQLGRAPLQRRLGSLVSGDSNSKCAKCLFDCCITHCMTFFADSSQFEPVECTPQIITTPTSMPSALPTPNSAAMDDVQSQSQLSPSLTKKPILKKNKGDDLNK